MDNLIAGIEIDLLQICQIFLRAIKPVLVPLCFSAAWLFVIALLTSLLSGVRQTVNSAQQMHQIPCYNCKFFTNDHRLKCTVNPKIASTEEAINCFDYQGKSY